MRTRPALVGFAAAMLLAGPALTWAALTPAKSLDRCQNTVRVQGQAFVRNTVKAVANCLDKVASELINKGAGDTSGAAIVCKSQLLKLRDTRPNRSLSAIYTNAVTKHCDPAQPGVTHDQDDITGAGPGLVTGQDLASTNLDAWCAQFGVLGGVNNVAKWITCSLAANESAASVAIAVQFPRALEWLASVKPHVGSARRNRAVGHRCACRNCPRQ